MKKSRTHRHTRIRKKVFGTQERPRLSVFRSLNNMYAQLINDDQQTTLLSCSTQDAAFKAKTGRGNAAAAAQLGELVAAKAKEKGITKVVFDRGGYLFHGRVKALAEAARKSGLVF